MQINEKQSIKEQKQIANQKDTAHARAASATSPLVTFRHLTNYQIISG